MCCFSGSVELVSDTNIFARGANGSQFLVYSMRYAAAEDLAMVLPLPVPPKSPEDAVRFISLERYPKFFDDLRRGFPRRMMRSAAMRATTLAADAPRLQVHEVGAYEASFVPRIADFERLDARFRLPADVWDKLGEYRDYGFAVFKLKGNLSRPSVPETGQKPAAPRQSLWQRWFGGTSGEPIPPANEPEHRRHERLAHEASQVHPLALRFPRRNSDLVYFPTVHVHDGRVHPQAWFDHTLYCQVEEAMWEHVEDWERSSGSAEEFMNLEAAAGIVEGPSPCWRTKLWGKHSNQDALVGKGGELPALVG